MFNHRVVFLFFIAIQLCVSGCSISQPPPVLQTQIVKVPVPCAIGLPKKPKDNGDLASAKQIAGYYKQIEMLLIDCQNVKDSISSVP